jgi:hypothetical protein
MDWIAMLFVAAVGASCVYAGYKLFCGLPALSDGPRASRASVLLLNVVPGALLALIGMGLLTAEARGLVSHRPAIRRQTQPAEGASWHLRKPGFFARAA